MSSVNFEDNVNLIALAYCERGDNHPYRLAEMLTIKGKYRRVAIPTKMLSSHVALRDYLIENDHPVVDGPGYWKRVRDELGRTDVETVKLVSAPGFYDDCYVNSNGLVMGSDHDIAPLLLDPNHPVHLPKEKSSGTFEEWKEYVAPLARHSSRLMLALCSAFGGILIRFTNVENGGFHFYGGSSKGKTSCLDLPASIFGDRSFCETWDFTDKGLEETVAGLNDSILLLNELALLEPDSKAGAKRAMKTVYHITEGRSRKRTKAFEKYGLTWRNVLISTGENSMETYAINGGLPRMPGEKVRLVDVPADCGKEMGLFESLPEGFDNPAAFAEFLSSQCQKFHGTAKEAFIAKVLKREGKKAGSISRHMQKYMDKFLQHVDVDRNNGFEYRMAKRFALAYAAGLAAIKAEVLTFDSSEVLQAIVACYHATLDAGTDLNAADEVAEASYQDLIARIKSLELVDMSERSKRISQERLEKAGGCYKHVNGKDILAITSKHFDSLIANKALARKMKNRLKEEGMLMVRSDGKLTRQLQFKSKAGDYKVHCFCFLREMLEK